MPISYEMKTLIFLTVYFALPNLLLANNCQQLPTSCNAACDSSCNYKKKVTGRFSLFTRLPESNLAGGSPTQTRGLATSGETSKTVIWSGDYQPGRPAGWFDPTILPFTIQFPTDTYNAISASLLNYVVDKLPVEAERFPSEVRAQVNFTRSTKLMPTKENAQYFTATYDRCNIETNNGPPCGPPPPSSCPAGYNEQFSGPYAGKCVSECISGTIRIVEMDGTFIENRNCNECTPATHCVNYVNCAYQKCNGTTAEFYVSSCSIGGSFALSCGARVSAASCPPNTPTFMCNFVDAQLPMTEQTARDAFGPSDTVTCNGGPPTCAGSAPPNDTMTVGCPAGQTGSITRSRSYSCVGTTWTAGSWTDTANSCVTPSSCTCPNTSCGAGYATNSVACIVNGNQCECESYGSINNGAIETCKNVTCNISNGTGNGNLNSTSSQGN